MAHIDISSFSEDQHEAYNIIADFVTHPSRYDQYICIHGWAGTGKTYVLAAALQRFPQLQAASPTGKAASVLRDRTGNEVRTVHGLIYDFKGLVQDLNKEDKKIPVFASKDNHGLDGVIVGLDESSMVGTKLANDLLKTRARVVSFGDPGQLKPVGDSQFFIKPTHTLLVPHRTALKSAIIRQAHRVRYDLPPIDDGEDFQLLEFSNDRLMEADVALCWKNKTRTWLNNRKREVLGYSLSMLRAGEPLMCLRNCYDLGIFNGETYKLAHDRSEGEDLRLIAADGRCIDVLNPIIEGVDLIFDELRYDDAFVPLTLSYSATVHKFQGSEEKHVLLIPEHPNNNDKKSWLYTGITRASKRVTLIKPRGK